MNTVTDYYNAPATARADMLATVGHGRRRAAASPFDEIARVGKDGQPYWSARDLADALGYRTNWRNFTPAILKARQQVAAHGNAGQDHFADVRKMITAGKGAEREVPDVHLTRFAAYFVALNADQSKPEVRAAVNYYFVGRTIQAEQMITAADQDNTLTAENAKRIADLELAVQGLPEVIGDAIAKALASTSAAPASPAKPDNAPRKRGKVGRPGLPSLTAFQEAVGGPAQKGALHKRFVRDGYLTRVVVNHTTNGFPMYAYSEGSHVGMFRFRKRPSGPYSATGNYVYVTEAGQRYLAKEYGWETP